MRCLVIGVERKKQNFIDRRSWKRMSMEKNEKELCRNARRWQAGTHHQREWTSKALDEKEEQIIDQSSEQPNEYTRTNLGTNGRTDWRIKKWREEQTDEKMNDTVNCINTAELPADWSRVFQCIERPWLQMWQMTMTDWLSSASSIFHFSVQRL